MARDSSLSRPSVEGPPSTERFDGPETTATWRALPGEPHTALGWVFGVPSLARLGFGVAFFVAVVVGGAVTHLPIWACVPSVVVTGLTGLYFRGWSRQAYAALPTHTDNPTSLPVRVSVIRDGRALGRDYGWIDFAGGWLVYQGLRMDFSLKTSDVVSRLVHEKDVDLFLGDGRKVRVRYLPVSQGRSASSRSAGNVRVIDAFRTWSRAPLAEGESRFPPTNRHPAITASFLRLLLLCVPELLLFGVIGIVIRDIWLALIPILVAAALLVVFARGFASLRRTLG